MKNQSKFEKPYLCKGGPLTAIDNGRYSVIGLNSHINTRVCIMQFSKLNFVDKILFYPKVKFNYGDYPGIYVRVGTHLPWIRKVTSLSN